MIARSIANILENLQSLLISIPAILVCLTIHECAHGFVAYKLGDPTAKNMGRLSLNPIKHIDPRGFLCLIFFRFGWAKPVPVNPNNFKHSVKGMAITAAAGPISNFLLSLVILFILRGLPLATSGILLYVLMFLYITASISIGLGVFNLLPIPPLDGSKILIPFLPLKARAFFYKYEQHLQVVLILLLAFGYLSIPLGIVRELIYSAEWALVNFVYGLFGA